MRTIGRLLVMAVCVGSTSLWAAGGDLPGSGTEGDPYLIEDLADFDEFADSVNAATYWASGVYTRLACDPNLADRTYTTAVIAPDTPDTDYQFNGTPYEGIFDGDGHVIRNLTIDSAGEDNYYLGLFGRVEGSSAVIKGLGMEDVDITGGAGSHYLGGLCGANGQYGGNPGGTISNCYSGGSVTGGDNSGSLGGLCGWNSDGTISNCYATGSVTVGYNSGSLGGLCGGNSHGTISNCYAIGSVTSEGTSRPRSGLGGLCGYNSSGTISNCYATGSVTDGDNSDYLGGLCGYNYRSTIINCYATGSVNGKAGSESAGGLCGRNDISTIINCYATGSVFGGIDLGGLCGRNSGSIGNCYATGAVTGLGDSRGIGGLCGFSLNYPISNCYFLDPEDGGGPDNGAGIPLRDAQMKQQYSFANWDFTGETANGTSEIWQMPTGGGYPELSIFNGYTPVTLSGDGTEGSPYLISNAMELGAIYHNSSHACFRLTDDIDLAGITWSTAVVPVFGGCFDGNGYTICNLNIEGGSYLGLFGQIEGLGAEIKNLGMENVNITGGDGSRYLGGLCGENSYGTISNCYSGGSVTGEGSLGGLCGWNGYGTISNCYSGGSVTGGGSLGGLCGWNGYGIISNCYSDGSVTGEGSLGGLCGGNYHGTINNCYATGSVTGGDYSRSLGGLCGWNDHGSISNCYATGSVTGGDSSHDLGGLCGQNAVDTISNCYFLEPVDGGGPDNGTGIPLAYAQMKQQDSFANWDFTGETANGTSEIWQMPTGDGYPVLSSFSGYIPVVLRGAGSEEKPYLISNAMELGAIYHYSSTACFKLGGDIDLTGITWSTSLVPVFGGCFDGNGHAIYNLNIEGGGHLGLFGRIEGSGAAVKNLRLENVNITGADDSFYLGGLCGFNWDATITNCYSGGSVTGGDDSDYLGGLCGYNIGTISNCYSGGSVAGGNNSESLGGLCGDNWDGTITNCYSGSSVTGGDDSGYLGGLCGWNTIGTFTNCYATGSVTGGDYLGGLCGNNDGGTISNCFWDIETGGADNGLGTPLPTAQMQTASTFIDAGWDFDTPVWTIDEGIDYPRFWWPPVLHGEPDVTLGTSNSVSWGPVDGGVEYYVECAEDEDFASIVSDSGWIVEASCEFIGLQTGQQYWYRVKAKNAAGAESGWSNVESSLQSTLGDAVDMLLDPASLKNKNMKNALLNKIDEAAAMIDEGLYEDALDKLRNDILAKTNGCAETGEADKNDWIIACEQQSRVYGLVMETIEYVRSLIE